MEVYKVFVGDKEGSDLRIEREIRNFGIDSVASVKKFTVFWLTNIGRKDLEKILGILHNPILQMAYISKLPGEVTKGKRLVEVVSNLGVINPREASVKKAASDLGITSEVQVKFGRAYVLEGKLSEKDLGIVKDRLLMKRVVEHEVEANEKVFINPPKYKFKKITVSIRGSSEEELLEISKAGMLSLNLVEMETIQSYFAKISRDPTDIELETIAQTWSEHCGHKTFKGSVVHNGRKFGSLLKETITDVTRKLNKKWVVSAFEDNAGGIKIGKQVVAVKVETHNHPSAIEPVGGAETGIGGVIRDILGFGRGAKPVSNIVAFCVGKLNTSYQSLPKGTLYPKAILSGIVEGTKSYGNQMGIPTDFFQDSVLVEENFVGNPLVFCGTVGVTSMARAKKQRIAKGDLCILLGGRTGRDGIHGVTFASVELDEKSETVSSGAVQIGDAITEKKTLDAILEMSEDGLIKWVTDCGGGGLSSAVGETGKNIGVRVQLEKVALKYEGLSYTEIWISEAQERMVVAVAPKSLEKIKKICFKHNLEPVLIGEFTGNKKLELFYGGNKVGDIQMDFLHGGCPKVAKTSVWQRKQFSDPTVKKIDFNKTLLSILAESDVSSKEVLGRTYDHSVQGKTILLPFVGRTNGGHTDATVRILAENGVGLALAIAINPQITRLDPRSMAKITTTQSLAKLVAVGSSLRGAALLDNFSWGNPNHPERLGELVEACLGCRDAALGFGVPFISGKDSLNNEFEAGGKTISIPGTLLVTAVGAVNNVKQTASMDFKEEGNLIYLLGINDGKLGASYFNKVKGFIGNDPPDVDFMVAKKTMKALDRCIKAGLVRSAHAITKGGLATALAEMAIAGDMGATVDINDLRNLKNHQVLFSESQVRFVVEVAREKKVRFEKLIKGVVCSYLGKVGGKTLLIKGGNKQLVALPIEKLRSSWQKTFGGWFS